eukprot:4739-Heterococcus_DN1.PRE.3
MCAGADESRCYTTGDASQSCLHFTSIQRQYTNISLYEATKQGLDYTERTLAAAAHNGHKHCKAYMLAAGGVVNCMMHHNVRQHLAAVKWLRKRGAIWPEILQ